jgi:hypothetical protein
MSETTPGANVPQDWIGEPVLVSVYAAGGRYRWRAAPPW